MAKPTKSGSSKKPTHDPDPQHKHVRPIGGYVLSDEPLEINAGRPTVSVEVFNTGDRPIQVGSHFHFFEANRALEFDRDAAFGKRLDIPATTAVRFEPGDKKTVQLVPFGGKQRAYGFNGLVDGWTGPGPQPSYTPNRDKAAARVEQLGFKNRAAKDKDKGKDS